MANKMRNLDFRQLDRCFRDNDFPTIENDDRGIRFLKLRSMSRKAEFEEFFAENSIDISNINSKSYFEYCFELESIDDQTIEAYINHKYENERRARRENEEFLIDQLRRLQTFDWGGSYGNSLEKNIVDNYVKKIQSFDDINDKIETNLLNSLRGYTLNSWYNHWTSILIEDIFKDNGNVFPTIGLIKKIDFFINNIPFDLKVTYFPEEYMKNKLKNSGFGVELTRLKRICRELSIYIPNDLNDEGLRMHLYSIISENQTDLARAFIEEIRNAKRNIIDEAERNPSELKVWFYENQGEARFDASNRFFLVLVDENDIRNSWKLKRNIEFLRDKINIHLDSLVNNMHNLDTSFFWKKSEQRFSCKSDILFVKYTD